MNHKFNSIKKMNIPDGVYDGLWGGWEVEIIEYGLTFRVDAGVRGINIPVIITVNDGMAVCEEK